MILFKVIRWKNLNATGNQFSEIKLDESKSTLFLGTNGSGKSTILDALCFGLFGKPFRNVNKPTILNSTNNRDLVVEIEFAFSGKEFKIIRGMKPNIFEIYCDGILINQSSDKRDYQEYLEKYILKFNFKSFTQIVILGSAAFEPFMQLKAAERRSIIEDLLDIQIFSLMNVVAKQKLSTNKEALTETNYNIKMLEEKKGLVELTLSKLHETNEAKLLELKTELNRRIEAVNKYDSELEDLTTKYDVLKEELGDKEKILHSKHNKLVGLSSKIESNLDKHKEHIKFYEVNDNCPVCKQGIDPKFKSDIVEKSSMEITKYSEGIEKINAEISNTLAELHEVGKKRLILEGYDKLISNKKAQLAGIKYEVKRLEKEISQPKHEGLIVDNQSLLEELEANIQTQIQTLNELSVEKEYLDTSILLLKDGGIKTRIINQYLPIINKQINTYLTAMGFSINFEIDDNFNETIKSQYRSEFSYNNFSEGEKLRIDLALLFTWRIVAKLKNSVNTNLLILDEIFDSSLDSDGIEDAMKMIALLAENTNVIVISPKADQMQDKFERVIKFQKIKGYTKMEIL